MSSQSRMLYSVALTGQKAAPVQQHQQPSTQTSTATPNTATRPINNINEPTRRSPHRRNNKYQTRAEHIPKTANPETCVYILTLQTSPSLQDPVNTLRKKYFPARLNRTPAHLTLFHALPHSHLPSITSTLSSLSSSTGPFELRTGPAFRMRCGIGIPVAEGSREAKGIHGQLRSGWMEWLSEQDRGGWRPHWTIMNKVDREEDVVSAFAEVEQEFQGAKGVAEGLELWRYEPGGRWIWEKGWKFEGE